MAVSKSTNGTGCWPTTRTTIARASSWIGSCSRLAVCVDATREEEDLAPSSCVPIRGLSFRIIRILQEDLSSVWFIYFLICGVNVVQILTI